LTYGNCEPKPVDQKKVADILRLRSRGKEFSACAEHGGV
jgi:hypothetical protein